MGCPARWCAHRTGWRRSRTAAGRSPPEPSAEKCGRLRRGPTAECASGPGGRRPTVVGPADTGGGEEQQRCGDSREVVSSPARNSAAASRKESPPTKGRAVMWRRSISQSPRRPVGQDTDDGTDPDHDEQDAGYPLGDAEAVAQEHHREGPQSGEEEVAQCGDQDQHPVGADRHDVADRPQQRLLSGVGVKGPGPHAGGCLDGGLPAPPSLPLAPRIVLRHSGRTGGGCSLLAGELGGGADEFVAGLQRRRPRRRGTRCRCRSVPRSG